MWYKLSIFLIGVIIGIIITFFGMDYIASNKSSKIVYEAKKEISFKGIVIPKGTLLYEKSNMPEGFNVLQFDIKIFRGYIDEFFITRNAKKEDYFEYWIEGEEKN